ncbi:MAG: hypothetical protein ACTSSG_13865 [Candidatus Heimdallarchaeaceae archaeon]
MNYFDEELIEFALEKGESLGAEYIEFRYQDKYLANFMFRDGELTSKNLQVLLVLAKEFAFEL